MSHETVMDSTNTSIIMPSIAGFLTVIQLVYWMTLFEITSFYVTLIIQAFSDIYAFMIILMIILGAFTVAVVILENNNLIEFEYKNEGLDADETLEHKYITSTRYGSIVVDAFYEQWLLGLGEFELLTKTDKTQDVGHQNKIKNLLWIYFLFATLMS